MVGQNYSTKNFYSRFGDQDTLEFAEIAVVVPTGVFAPEPSEWEKRWVNLWYVNEPLNQCQFRKRRITAYTIQPILVALWLIAKPIICIVAGIFCLLLWADIAVKELDWRPLFHPWRYKTEMFWRGIECEETWIRRAIEWVMDLCKKGGEETAEETRKNEKENFEWLYDKYKYAICENTPRDPLTVVSRSQKIYLKFRGLKKDHCKPLAR